MEESQVQVVEQQWDEYTPDLYEETYRKSSIKPPLPPSKPLFLNKAPLSFSPPPKKKQQQQQQTNKHKLCTLCTLY